MYTILLILAASPVAPAAEQGEEKVQVTVVTILATDRNAEVDPKLKCIAEEVQKLEPTLTGFRLARTTCKSLKIGVPHQFPLVDGESAQVKVQHGADKDNRVGLTVKPPEVGEIVYTSCCGKFFPILTRYHTKQKDRLIIAVMVRPCAGDSKDR